MYILTVLYLSIAYISHMKFGYITNPGYNECETFELTIILNLIFYHICLTSCQGTFDNLDQSSLFLVLFSGRFLPDLPLKPA